MNIKNLNIPGYDQVLEAELSGGIKSIIAVHNTKLGPALGGLRFYSYSSPEDGLTDVLRLSEGMSYKSALANLPLGGGKSIIIGDPQKVKTKALLEDMGEFVDSLKGQYITAKDIGITVDDLDVISAKTQFVKGTSAKGSSGDPSPITAYGVYKGMKAAAKAQYDNDSLNGKSVIIQGLGHVGYGVAKLLKEEGATLLGTDLSEERKDQARSELGMTILDANGWKTTQADIFCPCAMGGILHKETIQALSQNGVKIVAGGANNQLLDMVKDGERIRKSGILYAPDYVINAGGIINIYCELEGEYNESKATEITDKIYDTTLEIFERADQADQPTSVVSLSMARERLGLE